MPSSVVITVISNGAADAARLAVGPIPSDDKRSFGNSLGRDKLSVPGLNYRESGGSRAVPFTATKTADLGVKSATGRNNRPTDA